MSFQDLLRNNEKNRVASKSINLSIKKIALKNVKTMLDHSKKTELL